MQASRMLYKVEKFVVVWEWVGKEFLDMRQDERKIEFIRVGDAFIFIFFLGGLDSLMGLA